MMLAGIVFVLFVLWCIGTVMTAPITDENTIKQMVKERLQTCKNMFNSFQKRFIKCAYPYTDYLLALMDAQVKGIVSDLTEEQINFFLSYPKKYEFKKLDGQHSFVFTDGRIRHFDNYELIVNGINLGRAEKCRLLLSKIHNVNEKQPQIFDEERVKNFTDTMESVFFIDDYIINVDYSFMETEHNAIEEFEKRNDLFDEKLIKKIYSNIENESNEALKDCKPLITKGLTDFIDKLQEKDYSIKEMKELYEENNKKWRKEYFDKYTNQSCEEYFKDYKDPNIFYRLYQNDNKFIYNIYKDDSLFYEKGGEITYYTGNKFLNIRESHKTEETYKLEEERRKTYSMDKVYEYDKKIEESMTPFTQEEKNFEYNLFKIGGYAHLQIENTWWNEKYKNVVKDIELKYELDDIEPTITDDFRNRVYKNKIARKSLVDYVAYSPFGRKAIFHYNDGHEETLHENDK